MIVVLFLLLIFAAWASVITWKWIQLGKLVLLIEERIDNALNELEKYEKKISSVLEVPLASDDLLVRRVVADIRSAKKTMTNIISTLTDDFSEESSNVVMNDSEEKSE